MGPYFERAHVVVVPILTGAGIRVKIVEAMAAGRAIVSTSLGWEGLPHVIAGQHLLVADDAREFAAATTRLLREPELRRRIAAQARSLAEQHYDWRGLGDEQEAVLQSGLGIRRASTSSVSLSATPGGEAIDAVGPREREMVRRAAARAGLETPLRAVWEQLHPDVRRDRIDNEHIRLLMAFVLSENSNCVDIGAHEGAILREMVRCAPRGRHIAYEPLPEFAARLARDFPGVDVRAAAVSNRAGEDTFFRMVGGPMQSGLKLRTGTAREASEAFTVRVDKLDDALPDGYVPSLIKIDVEGAERQVIEGAMGILSDMPRSSASSTGRAPKANIRPRLSRSTTSWSRAPGCASSISTGSARTLGLSSSTPTTSRSGISLPTGESAGDGPDGQLRAARHARPIHSRYGGDSPGRH